MIKINQKRVAIIISALLVSLFAFSFQMAQEGISKENKVNTTIVTTATPVSGKTVIIDAGHGKPDERSRK